jgi:hypothetical protein
MFGIQQQRNLAVSLSDQIFYCTICFLLVIDRNRGIYMILQFTKAIRKGTADKRNFQHGDLFFGIIETAP